jgi:hypothetical protein
LAKAYVDQLERKACIKSDRIAALRSGIATAEKATATARRDALSALATQVEGEARESCDAAKMQKLASTMKNLMGTVP